MVRSGLGLGSPSAPGEYRRTSPAVPGVLPAIARNLLSRLKTTAVTFTGRSDSLPRTSPLAGSIRKASLRPPATRSWPSGRYAAADTGATAGTRGLTSGALAESSLAPAATQARRRATSSFLGCCLAFFGGMIGWKRPSVMVTRTLSSGLPGLTGLKLWPPFIIAWYVSRLRPPRLVAAEWHSRQYLARNGLTSLT